MVPPVICNPRYLGDRDQDERLGGLRFEASLSKEEHKEGKNTTGCSRNKGTE
jgi:hypothetical protein